MQPELVMSNAVIKKETVRVLSQTGPIVMTEIISRNVDTHRT
jgi:hypothetical protein